MSSDLGTSRDRAAGARCNFWVTSASRMASSVMTKSCFSSAWMRSRNSVAVSWHPGQT